MNELNFSDFETGRLSVLVMYQATRVTDMQAPPSLGLPAPAITPVIWKYDTDSNRQEWKPAQVVVALCRFATTVFHFLPCIYGSNAAGLISRSN